MPFGTQCAPGNVSWFVPIPPTLTLLLASGILELAEFQEIESKELISKYCEIRSYADLVSARGDHGLRSVSGFSGSFEVRVDRGHSLAPFHLHRPIGSLCSQGRVLGLCGDHRLGVRKKSRVTARWIPRPPVRFGYWISWQTGRPHSQPGGEGSAEELCRESRKRDAQP